MALIETLLVHVGTSVTKAVVRIWLKNPGIVGSVEGVADALSKRTDDIIAKRNARALFENIETDIALRMERFIALEYPGSDDADRNAAAQAVGVALASIDLTVAAIESDLDATRLALAALNGAPLAIGTLGGVATDIARSLLAECCHYIVRIAGALPNFNATATAEMLRREHRILDDIRRVLDAVTQLRLEQSRLSEGGDVEFNNQYRLTLQERLDSNQLFGLHLIGAGARPLGLSNTYVPQALVANSSLKPVEAAIGYAAKLLLVRGEAGLGKTTLMQWLAVQAVKGTLKGSIARWNAVTPFYLRMRDWGDIGEPFPAPEEFLSKSFRLLAGTMPHGWIHYNLRKGALVLVDGIDEVRASRRGKLLNWLRELIKTFPGTSFVVTSRPAALDSVELSAMDSLGSNDAREPVTLEQSLEQTGFRTLLLEPMTLNDSLTLALRWHAAAAHELGNQEKEQLASNERTLCQAIRNRPAIRNLAANPLLCAMMCALSWGLRQHLPDDRMALYRQVLNILLTSRDQDREVGATHASSLDHESKEILLDDLAYWMLRNDYSEVDRGRAEEALKKTLQRLPHLKDPPGALMQELLERSGVLRQPQHGVIDFVHRTFMEYMGARAAVQSHDVGLLVDKARKESWREVIVFAAGHATRTDRDALIRRLLSRPIIHLAVPRAMRLTTVCCLETVSRNLDRLLLQQLHSVAETLFPPNDFEMARLLAPAAAAEPELLEGHHGRNPVVIAACIRSAALVGGERMLSVVESYAKSEGELLDQEIIRAWPAFEQTAFEQRVIIPHDSFFGQRLSKLTPEGAEYAKLFLLLNPSPKIARTVLNKALLRSVNTGSLTVLSASAFRPEEGAVFPDQEEPGEYWSPSLGMRERREEYRHREHIGPQIMRQITRLKSLRALELGKVDPTAIPIMEELTSLTTLSLILEEHANLRPIVSIPRLEAFGIAGDGIVTLALFRSKRTLSKIAVSCSENYNTLDFISTESQLKYVYLEDLHIEDFAPLAELAGLRELAIYRPKRDAFVPYARLQRLRGLQLRSVNPSFLVGLENHPAIEDLRISFCSLDQEIDLKGLGSLNQLTRLHLQNCTLSDCSAAIWQQPLEEVSFHHFRADDFGKLYERLKLRGVNVRYSEYKGPDQSMPELRGWARNASTILEISELERRGPRRRGPGLGDMVNE
jgi:hypothetical protein